MTIEDITSDFDEGAGELIIKASEYCALCSRIKELEEENNNLKSSIQDIKDAFRTGRDSTATGYGDYHVGMANGIEWALSCLELREPKYFECGRKEPLLDMREILGSYDPEAAQALEAKE